MVIWSHETFTNAGALYLQYSLNKLTYFNYIYIINFWSMLSYQILILPIQKSFCFVFFLYTIKHLVIIKKKQPMVEGESEQLVRT